MFIQILACTAERFFRVDRAQENLHYVSDIGHECLFILDTGIAPLTPDTETTNTGPSESSAGPMSFDTTTGQSISLDISHSMDTPSAGVSLDVPESHNRLFLYPFNFFLLRFLKKLLISVNPVWVALLKLLNFYLLVHHNLH